MTDDVQNWSQASAKSFKSGCVEGSVADTVRCDWINVHMDRPFATSDGDDIDLSVLDGATDFVVYGWIATSSSALTGDYVVANLKYNTEAPGASATLLSGKSTYEALTDDEKQTISDWTATLDPRNPTPTVLEESDDDDDAADSDDDAADSDADDSDEDDSDADDSDADADDSDADADDSDEEVLPDAASYMTVAAATITAVGAILI